MLTLQVYLFSATLSKLINVNVNIDMNVQNVMNESDARVEDDLGRREAEVMCF